MGTESLSAFAESFTSLTSTRPSTAGLADSDITNAIERALRGLQ